MGKGGCRIHDSAEHPLPHTQLNRKGGTRPWSDLSASGFASVTCTCRRERPAACAGQRLPGSIDRACGLFDDAAGTPDTAQAARRLRKGLRALKESIAKSRKSGVSRDCVRALKAELRDAKERAGRVLGRR